MEVINAGMRKVIKGMCVTSQTLQFVALMPKPEDFVTRLTGDVVYLSAQIQKLSDKMNRLLDDYASIPSNYLMTQMNSITGSLSGITNRLDIFSQYGVNQTIGLGENTSQIISGLTGSAIDISGSAVKAATGLSAAAGHLSSNIMGKLDAAEDIQLGAETILEWTGNEFKNINETATSPINNVTQTLTDARTGVTDKIGNKADNVKDKLEDSRKSVEKIITNLKDKMAELSKWMDNGFGNLIGNKISNGSAAVSTALGESGNNSPSSQMTQAVSSSLSSVVKNFSIGKVASAFVGFFSQTAMVSMGLDELPPIDFESMLSKIRNDTSISSKDLQKQYELLVDESTKLMEFGDDAAKIPSEDRNYSSENYDGFMKEYDGELKKKRDMIRTMMKNNYDERGNVKNIAADTLAKREMRSAIKEMEKYRKQVKKAKEASTYKDIVRNELDYLKKEAEYRFNSFKSTWNSMTSQYTRCIDEIKSFFTNGGSCDQFIDDCCDAINLDFNTIEELCKSLTDQLIGCAIKVAMPADIILPPNPGYKIPDFIMDIKTILKFIKDMIVLVLDIINNINKLARIMLNGLNSLKEIIEQLMDILGLTWLMNLIQSIIDLFGSNLLSVQEKLLNTLSPVYYSDTDEYDNIMEALDDLLGGVNLDAEKLEVLSTVFGGENERDVIISKVKNEDEDTTDKLNELVDSLEKLGDEIVAYKSPIIECNKKSTKVSDLISGGNLDSSFKFIGWHFFHPNLNEKSNDQYFTSSKLGNLIRKIQGKIIKKASKNGHKKRGGVKKLKSRNVGWIKGSSLAYDAFYWYTYYTEDLEQDCYVSKAAQSSTMISSTVQTENGSIVEVTDINGNKRKVFVANSNVRSGDYVNVDGVKYRVK